MGSSSNPIDVTPCDEETTIACDYFDGVYDYIKQMLMEEDDLEHRPCMFQDCSALQAAEKYFKDALGKKDSSPPDGYRPPRIAVDKTSDSVLMQQVPRADGGSCSQNKDSERKKYHSRENEDCVQGRTSKQLASYVEESEHLEKYDKALLCPNMNPGFYGQPCDDEKSSENTSSYRKMTEAKRGRPRGSKKKGNIKEVIDWRSLLNRCAQAAANYNTTTGHELLREIRQYSPPRGDATERLAHYFANALEARLTGTGPSLYMAFSTGKIPAAVLLKAYQTYVTACPFKRMSNIFANKSIGRQINEATRIHIIDFGILYGFQWPCIIQGISLKPGGPPVLRITGIDFPQSGFRPAERVEQTGRRLQNYCKRFNVPFEYNAIVQKWDTISLEDLKIDRNEMLVVNCMYRLRHVPDESVSVNSPRDAVLNLIKKINPDLFVHGIVNGTYNAAFFSTRFKEALYNYSSFFDMLEATIPREDQDRLLYEREVFGRDVMNVIACEGFERVERPETYKKWQARNQKAGFQQLPLNQEIMKEIKAKVQRGYHKDFLLDEDSQWMLQGWKGRVLYALSCWKPHENE
ncbi:Scarecrow-like protein 14 [Abeliophyllum distichum]|uniref:Scarecrow-like protein 14 n=1 Tax=Abeliophyllum distichum TaxID=126358 RepID=A0ABD1VX79_9LAMI